MNEEIEITISLHGGAPTKAPKAEKKASPTPQLPPETPPEEPAKAPKQRAGDALLVHYSELDAPYLELYHYKGGKLADTSHIDLENGSDGTPSEQAIAALIGEKYEKIDEMYLLISSRDVQKYTVTAPKINLFRANRMYAAEIREVKSRFAEKYVSFCERYVHPLGYIYYTYFVPSRILTLFSKAAVLMKCTFRSYDLFVRHLVRTVHERDAVIYYEEYGRAELALSYGGLLAAQSGFFATPEAVKRDYVSVICKHFFELEKKEVASILVSASAVPEIWKDTAKTVQVPFDALPKQWLKL